jgi:hypothetical protein
MNNREFLAFIEQYKKVKKMGFEDIVHFLGDPDVDIHINASTSENKMKNELARSKTIGHIWKPKSQNKKIFGDRIAPLRGFDFRLEAKVLSPTGRCSYHLREAIDILLPNGHTVHTNCVPYGRVHILSLNLFHIIGKWDSVYIKNSDLPRLIPGRTRRYSHISDEDASYLISSDFTVKDPSKYPYRRDLLGLMHEMIDNGEMDQKVKVYQPNDVTRFCV